MTTIYAVIVDDHTHLGGPMGSEYITTISRTVCRNLVTARAEFARREEHHKVKGRIPTPKVGTVYDYGHVGIHIEREKVL